MSTQEAEAEGFPQAQGQPGLQSECKTSLNCAVKPARACQGSFYCQKDNKKENDLWSRALQAVSSDSTFEDSVQQMGSFNPVSSAAANKGIF